MDQFMLGYLNQPPPNHVLLHGHKPSLRTKKRNRVLQICQVVGALLLVTAFAVIVTSHPFSRRSSTALQDYTNDVIDHPYPQSVEANMNLSTNPCNNFYEFACGRWLHSEVIPPDKSDVSLSFDAASDGVEDELRSLYEQVYPRNSQFRNVYDWYQSCLNLTRIEERGSTPLIPYLRKIDSIKSKQDLDNVLVFLMLWRIHPLISFAVDSDARNSSINVLTLNTPSLLFPAQHYVGWPVPTDKWWDTDGFEYRDIPGMENDRRLRARLKAAQYYKKINELAGYSSRHAEAAAVKALWVETELAMWVQADKARAPAADQDPAGPAPIDLAALEAGYGGVPWRGILQAISRKCARRGLSCANSLLAGEPRAVVRAPAYYARASAALAAWPPERWIPFLRTSAIRALAPYLGAAFGAAGLAPAAEVHGVRALPPRRAACVRATAAALPGLSEQLYIERHFPPEAAAAGAEVLRFVRDAFVARVADAPWMDSATARRALDKARAMAVNLGGGAGGSALALEGGPADPRDYFGNAQRADQAAVLRRMHLLDIPADRSRWPLPATAANAAYSERQNAVFVPAALMRPPFFSPAFDMARNFGGVGAVVGHEMTHGFDSAGRRFDAAGEYAAWWDTRSEARFLDGAACLRRLYGGFAIAGARVAARRVLREGIADAGGAAVALRAYRAWHRAAHGGAQPPPAGERLFFAAFGQLWCDKGRLAHVRLEARTGDHAPGVFRCNAVASQSVDFAAAFACRPGSPMNPPDKCAVW